LLDCLYITIVGSNLPPQSIRLGRSVLAHTSAKSYSAQPRLNFAQSCTATAHALLRVIQCCSLLLTLCSGLLKLAHDWDLDASGYTCSGPDSGPLDKFKEEALKTIDLTGIGETGVTNLRVTALMRNR
jgi:hypothetical protein